MNDAPKRKALTGRRKIAADLFSISKTLEGRLKHSCRLAGKIIIGEWQPPQPEDRKNGFKTLGLIGSSAHIGEWREMTWSKEANCWLVWEGPVDDEDIRQYAPRPFIIGLDGYPNNG